MSGITDYRPRVRLRRMKTYLCASLSQRKFNHLLILRLYADEVDALNMNAIVNEFIL